MSYYSVKFDNLDTIDDFGLILLDDLKITMPNPKTKFVEVPEMDGALDLTQSLTGYVQYGQREISFTLFAAMHPIGSGNKRQQPQDQTQFGETRRLFTAAVHGKRMNIYLPTMPSDAYYTGRVIVGEEYGYNRGRIPVKIIADPYWRMGRSQNV